MEKQEIIITHAASNENEIIFYLNSRSNSYVKGTYINEGKSIYISIEDEKEDLSNEKSSKFSNVILSIILTAIFFLINAFFFLVFLGKSIHFCLAFILSTPIPLLIILCEYEVSDFRFYPFKSKMNHATEHMIINFINNYQRLPICMEELQKSSRFHKKCGTLTKFKDFLHFIHFSNYLYVSILVYAILVFTNKGISLQEKVFTSIILVVIIILLRLLLEKKSYLLNFLLQLSNTTSHVDNDSLYLAYFVAREWIARDYSEYLTEQWMQNSEFLDDVSKIHSIDSQEASNI